MELLLIVACIGGAAFGAYKMTPKNWIRIKSPGKKSGAFFINKIDSFFENEEFSLLLNFLKKNNKIVQLIEKKINHKKRLLLKIEEVKKIKDLNNLFNELKIF